VIESKIALVHAIQLAVQPVASAFDEWWPQAQRMNVLDDSLAADLDKAGSLNASMTARVVNLARYAKASGAQGILFTCSAFGPAIEEAGRTLGIPTLKPNEAMFDEALKFCRQLPSQGRIGLLTTFAPAASAMHEELQAAAAQSGFAVHIETACASGAMEALNAGDGQTHDRLILECARTLPQCDVLMLGQFSMARAQGLLASACAKPVLTSPGSAVRRLKAALGVRH
jgi:Asp/Glu/Hydantoin racemase